MQNIIVFCKDLELAIKYLPGNTQCQQAKKDFEDLNNQ